MPAPSAAYILSMLNPYQGFNPATSAQLGLEVGQHGLQGRQQTEHKREFNAENARAVRYMDMQQQQFEGRQADQLKDNQVKALQAFQQAIDNGDTEQASQAANVLRAYGVNVEEYSPTAAAAPAKPTAQPNALGALASQSPTAKMAQTQAKKPMSAKDAQTSRELDQLAANATVDSGDPMAALPPVTIPRPGPARPGGLPNRPPVAEIPPEQPEAAPEAGLRPEPARTQMLKGDEPSPEQPQKRGYRLSFGGQTMDIDPETVAQRQRDRVAATLAPLVRNASTPEEQRAAVTAIESAVSAVGTVSPQDAIAYGLKLYQDPLNRSAKEKRARIISGKTGSEGYGGVAGLTEDEKKRSLDAGKYARTLINDEMTRSNVKGIREELAQGEDAISKAKSPDALAQFSSKATLQKMLMKGALSDRDVARLEGATGQWNRLEQIVNNWTEGGQIPPEVIRQIVEIARKKNALLRERLDQAGQAARERVMNDPTLATIATPEEQDDYGNLGYGAATGVFATRKTQRQQGTKAKGSVPAAPQTKASPSGANERARRLLGK